MTDAECAETLAEFRTLSERGTGRTSMQIAAAPKGAVFVWCNGDIGYARTLANRLGRNDLGVKPLSWLSRKNVVSRRDVVVIDHATELRGETAEVADFLAARGRLAK